ncbi:MULTISPECIES: sensor histidine kinase [Mumia]|uniref:Sensor histidine kinase n=1 Tax=Mumia xiangluensis TaxID=1678900 RepID=A0ABW1QHT8_9ACTN|nr:MULTISPECIES: histidine kinase [Mumia]
MNRVAAWWHPLSDRQRFRLYSRVALEGAVVAVVVAMAFAVTTPWSRVLIVVAGLAGVAAIEARPELTDWPRAVQRRAAVVAAAVLVVVGVVSSVVAHSSSDDAVVDDASVTGLLAVLLIAVAIVPFLRWRWYALAVVAVLAGLAYGSSPTEALQVAAVVAVVGAFMATTTLLTLWSLRVVEDLEHAKSVEAELRVAEERLRFSRDLHDVVGRGFSAVAVKSELAATLTRAGEHDRAAAEMDDVKAIAVESMEQMRALVQGYREVSLSAEVAGAQSLLSAAGCRLVVEGDPATVPTAYHEAAAWVVREGTTNIVKHSAATTATLTLGPEGMSLTNDAAGEVSDARAGQRGLAERLAEVGARMRTSVHDDLYVLEVRWETS